MHLGEFMCPIQAANDFEKKQMMWTCASLCTDQFV